MPLHDPTVSRSAAPSAAAPAGAPAPDGGRGAPPGEGAGARWLRWAPAALVVFAALAAFLAPLYEDDLAQHLAVGEWIWRHHALPFVESFAWTRVGQPFYAYSWLVQVSAYGMLRAFGPWGLHVLEAVVVAAAVLAALWAARALRLRPAAALALAALHLALLWSVASTIRPQQVLMIALPLVWGLAARIREDGATPRRLLGLLAVGALVANSHIFFPLTAAPIGYYLLADARRSELRRWLAAGAALVVGWLLSPYGLIWPRVFLLYFGHSALLQRPPSIVEEIPGFEYFVGMWGVMAAVAALLAAAWVVAADERRPARSRAVTALFWGVGLGLFAFAGRLIFAWWALSFPLVAEGAERALVAGAEALRRPFARLVAVGIGAIVLLGAMPAVRPELWRYEGDTVHRMLPRAAENSALWLPGWLVCHTRPGAHGRIFTEFNYGSELLWRLPAYSPDIDSRGVIFPDSDAAEFALTLYGRRRYHASTWTRADVVLVNRTLWVAPLLDADTGWIFLAQGGPGWAGGALWAKRAWWREWALPGTITPAHDVVPGDPRGTCPATGVFPKP